MRVVGFFLLLCMGSMPLVEGSVKLFPLERSQIAKCNKNRFQLLAGAKWNLSSYDQEQYPAHLLHYVYYRMDLIQSALVVQNNRLRPLMQEYAKRFFQEIHEREIISNLFTHNRLPLDFDFDIKYKKIKETKGERPSHLMLNYIAREAEIAEGFEAGETLFGAYQIFRGVKLMSHIALFEKWMVERKQYEEAYHMEVMSEEMQEDERKITGTIKYGVGWLWDIEMRNQKKMSVEFMMQQKTYNQWQLKEELMQTAQPSGIRFDHWVMTFTFDF